MNGGERTADDFSTRCTQTTLSEPRTNVAARLTLSHRNSTATTASSHIANANSLAAHGRRLLLICDVGDGGLEGGQVVPAVPKAIILADGVSEG